MSAAAELAEYIACLNYADLPGETVRSAKEAILDHLGVMLIGSTLPWSRSVCEVALELQSRPQSTIVAHRSKVCAPDAAMVNATYAQSCELDDVGFGGGGHAGAITVPTALAICEAERLSGKSLILALVLGYQVMHQIGRVISGPVLNIGFHNQSVLGPFGAAAVAAKLLASNRDRIVHALAIAGSHASGTMEYDQRGGEVKRYHSGMAARAGIMSALLAGHGLTGPETIFEGKRGILPLFGRVNDARQLTTGLERRGWYAIQGRSVKVYPVVGMLHTAIQAMERLIHEYGFSPDEVAAVDVWVTPVTLTHGGAVLQPTDTVGAQFSMAFSLALLIATGRNDLRAYMDPTLWSDVRIRELSARVNAHADHKYGPDLTSTTFNGARVAVTLRNGARLEAEELHRKGSPQNPISHEDLVQKFRSLAASVLDGERIDQVVAAVECLTELDSVADLTSLLVPEE